MAIAMREILRRFNLQPVLIDIGASGSTPPLWEEIAAQSVYIGFDPDQRELREIPGGKFSRSIIVNKAVTSEASQAEIPFYLTRFPYCSSTLRPDLVSLSHFIFSDFFVVDREIKVQALSLDTLLDNLSISRVHWFKTDSQGTDLRLFTSVKEDIRTRILAVDIEPGLIDAYQGEDLFLDAHRYLTKHGFWLSDLKIDGSIRMRQSTLHEIATAHPEINSEHIGKAIRKSPCWTEARYLRSTEWLSQPMFREEDYLLLWAFAILDQQTGFALDLGVDCATRFGSSQISTLMKNEALTYLRKASKDSALDGLLKIITTLTPQRLRRRLIKRIRSVALER
jgi:hypothetical protein